MVISLVRLIISSVVKGIDGRGIRNAGEGYINKNISLRSILKVISRLLSVSITSPDLMAFFQE